MESVENHENQNSEKATNDPLYKEGPQKNSLRIKEILLEFIRFGEIQKFKIFNIF